MRTARLLAVLAGVIFVLLALLSPRMVRAAGDDGGAPAGGRKGAASSDAGAQVVPPRPVLAPSSGGDAGADAGSEPAVPADAASAAPAAAAPPEPTIALPQTVAEQAEGLPIVALDVIGNRRVSSDDILSYLREKAGHLFKVENLTADVHALWDSGFFDDVEVDLTTPRRRASSCASSCASARTSRRSTFEGNDEIDNDKLNEAIEVKPNTILSVPAVRRSVQKIHDTYAEKGYFLAEVAYEVVPAARQRGRRQVQDHRARAGHRSPHHLHRQRPRLRRRAARSDAHGQRRVLRRSAPAARSGRTCSSVTS